MEKNEVEESSEVNTDGNGAGNSDGYEVPDTLTGSGSSFESSDDLSTAHGDDYRSHHHVHFRPIWLAMLLIACGLYFVWGQLVDVRSEVSETRHSIAVTSGRNFAAETRITSIDKEIAKYKDSIYTLELNKTLITLDEVVKNSKDKTKLAAINARNSILELKKTMK